MQEYRAIGILMGIIVRTGLVQDMPFASLMYAFLSTNRLIYEDIYGIDENLRQYHEEIRGDEELEGKVRWSVVQWDGELEGLPGRDMERFVRKEEVEEYIMESLEYRKSSILVFMEEIRKGFRENVGIKSHPMMTGQTLSYLVQGSGIITLSALESCCEVKEYSGKQDPNVQRFFRVVERLSPGQKKLLLRFITTLNRLPNSATNPNFTIKIDRSVRNDPDSTLPTASTCFNTIHWPQYSDDDVAYEKLLIAIKYCQTMDRQ